MNVASLMRRERPIIAEFFEWLEGELPPVFRASVERPIRVEDYVDSDGRYVLRAELPGIDPAKDVTVTVDADVLTVKAERRDETKEDHRSEFRYGSFTRTITLPAGADEDDVMATYADGILEVRVRVQGEKTEPRQIPVTAG